MSGRAREGFARRKRRLGPAPPLEALGRRAPRTGPTRARACFLRFSGVSEFGSRRGLHDKTPISVARTKTRRGADAEAPTLRVAFALADEAGGLRRLLVLATMSRLHRRSREARWRDGSRPYFFGDPAVYEEGRHARKCAAVASLEAFRFFFAQNNSADLAYGQFHETFGESNSALHHPFPFSSSSSVFESHRE